MNLRISAVLSLLLVSSSLYASDPVLSVVTSFSKTGGIYGNGIVDVRESKVNGRIVCDGNNTNANTVPGCDMSFDPGYNDNNTSEPDDDFYTGDLIVRTNDIFEMNVGWTAVGTKTPVTISSTLPDKSKGHLRWETLPYSCKDGSFISEDGLDMSCVRSGYGNGLGSYSEDLPFHIKVKANTKNDTHTGVIKFTVSNDEANTTEDDTDGTELIITAAPKWNVQKKHISTSRNQTVNINGEDVNGSIIRYAYIIESDEVEGEEESSSAVLGNEALDVDTELNFTDNVHQISPNAKLIGCDIVPISGEPFPYYDSDHPEWSTSSNQNDLNVTCTQDGGAGENISINYSGIDMSLSHVATHTMNGSIMPLTRMHLGSGVIDIFVPLSDIKKDSNKQENDTWQLDTNNTITDFDPISISGQSNFGDKEEESLKDNTVRVPLYYYGPGYVGGDFAKYFMKDIDHIEPLETTTNGWYSADGIVTPDRRFGARVHFSNSGNKDFNNTIVCDVLDKETYFLVSKAKPHWNTEDLNYTIEYATTYHNDGDWSPDLSKGNSAEVIEQCSGLDDSEWKKAEDIDFTKEDVSMVRLRIPDGVPHGKTVGFLLDLQARSNFLSGGTIPNGTELVNYSAVKDSVRFASNSNNWYGANRVLNEYPIPASHGYKADRAILTRAIVRTSKELSTNITEPSEEVEVTIHSTFTTDYKSAEKANVKITERLDKGLKYVIGSANIGDPTIGTCDNWEGNCTDDQQVLVWDLGKRTPGDAIENIIYRFVVGAVTPQGTSHTYTIISSPTDASSVNVRKANRNITVNIPSALMISKEVDTPFVPLDTDIEFTSYARNGTTKNLTNLDIIDILPFNGDARKGFDYTVGGQTIKKRREQPTSFNGTLVFKEASAENCDGNITWRYAKRKPNRMNISPRSQDGTTWYAGSSTGPDDFNNSEVTAVRLTGPSLGADGICTFHITLTPENNKKGDIYTNTTSAFAKGVSLSVLSNDVSAIVPTTLLGDFVWLDYDANGIQDKDEIGAEGITMELLDEDNVSLDKTTITDENGSYIFDELLTENDESTKYRVQATIPDYYSFTTQKAGSNRKKDSDVDSEGISGVKKLNYNQQYRHFDIGITSKLTISGKAYKQEDNTSMSERVTIKLYRDNNGDGEIDDDDTFVSKATDAEYEFTNIFNGKYIVEILEQKISTTDGDYVLNSEKTLNFEVNGTDIEDKNFKYNKVPESPDLDKDEILNTSDAVDIENLTAIDDDAEIHHFVITQLPDPKSGTLYYADGSIVHDEDNLTQEEADNLKFNPNTGFMGRIYFNYLSVDNDGEKSNRASVFINIIGNSTISNLVWYDENRDGVQDSGENGVAGVQLQLQDKDGNIIKDPATKFQSNYTVTTDNNGSYIFEKLSDGNYTVKVINKNGYALSNQAQDNDNKNDSDFNTTTFKTDEIILDINETNPNIDLGLFVPIVSGHLYHDGNGNAEVDGNLTNNADGTQLYVTLVGSNNKAVASKALDNSGNYSFDIDDGLKAYASYTLVLNKEADKTTSILPTDWYTENNPNGEITISVTRTDIINQDFGINKKPVAKDKNATIQFNSRDKNATVPTFDIGDLEDETPTTIKITQMPTNGKLYYKGKLVTETNNTFEDVNQSAFVIDPNDGDLNVTFKYQTIDRAGVLSNEATVIMPFNGLKISGAIYADGNNNDKVDGKLIDDSLDLVVRLIDKNGMILASKPINRDGNYTFEDRDGIVNDTNYTIILTKDDNTTASLPENWNNTGEQIGTDDNDTDGDANGEIRVNVLTVDIPNINFGINEKPIALDTNVSSVLNPGGDTRVVLPMLEIRDNEDETPTTIKIVTIPTNGTLYYGDSEVTAGTVIRDYNSSLLSVDPDAGKPVIKFTYLTIDQSNIESDIATVIFPFTGISISGYVYSDGNNDDIINGTKIEKVNDKPIYIVLLNSSNEVISSTLVADTGAYSFSESDGKIEPNRNYKLVISTIKDKTSSTLPYNWNYFDGEGIGAVNRGVVTPAHRDDTRDGIVSVEVKEVSIPQINFGINQQPIAEDNSALAQLNPGQNTVVSVPKLYISDKEDTNISNITIKQLPTNGTLYYDGKEITSEFTIADFNNSKLKVDPIDGEQTVIFTYTTTDVTGFESEEGTITMPFRGIQISGNIFDDGNADGDVNGRKISKAGDTPLFVNLLSSSGKLIASYPLDSTRSHNKIGVYSFDGNSTITANTNYKIILTTDTNGTKPLLPSDWNNLDGEKIGLVGLDDKSDGMIDVNVSTTDVININFGINQRPTTKNVASPMTLNPYRKVQVVNFLADDSEDGIPHIITINTLPKGGTLYYNNKKVVAGQNITDFNMSKLMVEPNHGDTVVVFTYSATDITGWTSAKPSRVRMPFYVPAPQIVDTPKDTDKEEEIEQPIIETLVKEKEPIEEVEQEEKTPVIFNLDIADDSVEASTEGSVTTINVLDNDDIADGVKIVLLDFEEGQILWNEGTAVGGTSIATVTELYVPGEGTWRVMGKTVVFTAEDGFKGTPTPIYYLVEDAKGNQSNVAELSITTPCTCEAYVSKSSKSVSALGNIGMFILLIVQMLSVLLFFRKEELAY